MKKLLGLKEYFDLIDTEVLRRRLKMGFIGKRSKGGIKYFQPRFFVLVSAKTLDPSDIDDVILQDSQLAPWMTVDVLYYFQLT